MSDYPGKKALNSYQHSVQLYDPECLLKVRPEVAEGYLILLSDTDPSLPFLALTHGNVLDICFGSHPNRPDEKSPAYRSCLRAKNALQDAADCSEAVPRLARETYAHAFHIIIDYHRRIRKMFFCFRACRRGRLIKQTKAELEQLFLPLREVLASST
jgi:hypothetical protein